MIALFLQPSAHGGFLTPSRDGMDSASEYESPRKEGIEPYFSEIDENAVKKIGP